MMKRILTAMTVAAFAVLLWSCSDQIANAPDATPITVSASLADLGMTGSVTHVTLEVSGSDFTTITRELTFVDGVASVELSVPFGANRHFRMTAYDAEEVALYEGESTSDIIAGAPTVVSLLLEPLVTMLRVAPMYQATFNGDLDTVSVVIHDIDSLFGIAFRIEYDTSVIEVQSVLEGGFLDPSGTIILTIKDSNYVAVGYSLTQNQPIKGVSGSGTVVDVVYFAKAAGRSSLAILDSGDLSPYLNDWQGNRLPRDRRLYIENAEVEVIEP